MASEIRASQRREFNLSFGILANGTDGGGNEADGNGIPPYSPPDCSPNIALLS